MPRTTLDAALIGALRVEVPHRRRTRKGVEIVRTMLPYWQPREQTARELGKLVETWIEHGTWPPVVED